MRLYTVNWEKFVEENLPVALRRPLVLHFLNAAFAPLRNLHTKFTDWREDWLYKIRHASQVVHIEKVLNDRFDSTLRRIYIMNVTFDSYIYLWPDGENPHYLQEEGADPDNPLYLLNDGAGTISPDATIYVPLALKPATPTGVENFENQMRALVDYYKTWGVNYQIVYYE